jgi:hypothetical protein
MKRSMGPSASAVRLALAGCMLLAGCGGAEGWTKAGSDADATAREYRDCLAMAGTAEKTDIDIDQDIATTRSSDIQRSSVVRLQTQETRQTDSDRGATIVASCMQAKGFAPTNR